MNRRTSVPADAALTDNLRPLANALLQAKIAFDDAAAEHERLRSKARDTEAQVADDAELRALLASGKKAPAKLPSKAVDALADQRRIAAAMLRNAERAEQEAAHAFQVEADKATDALIDRNAARAAVAGDKYKQAINAFLQSRGEYMTTIRDLGRAWVHHLDVEHKKTNPTHSRRIQQSDPGPRFDALAHPTAIGSDINVELLPATLEYDATRHIFHDPRTGPDPARKRRSTQNERGFDGEANTP